MRFPPADARHLHLHLADAASGTPCQWWHLEIAARHQAGPASAPARLLGTLLRWPGSAWMTPLLDRLGLPGLAPYRLPPPAQRLQRAEDAALAAACLLGALAGLGSLNATREMLLVLLALLGGLAAAWQSGWQAARQRRELLQQQAARAALLTPSESTLGLTGLLVAAGQDYATALARTEQLALQPSQVSRLELAQLGLTMPARGEVAWQAMQGGLSWLLGAAAVAWPCWLTASRWQFIPALLGLLLVHFVSAAERPRQAWRRPLQHLLAAMVCLAAGSLVHWL
ncbi:hypothetical protein [Chitinimonas sp.]|uniref:hypothetical protein n=1 Tax=Chitinimonas sp. TaxID=1934313 RepID=UPI002F93E50F